MVPLDHTCRGDVVPFFGSADGQGLLGVTVEQGQRQQQTRRKLGDYTAPQSDRGSCWKPEGVAYRPRCAVDLRVADTDNARTSTSNTLKPFATAQSVDLAPFDGLGTEVTIII